MGMLHKLSDVDMSTNPSLIKHVVIIVKENHGYDNYFGAYPGGNGVTLPTSPNPPPHDPDHRHAAWLTRDQSAPRDGEEDRDRDRLSWRQHAG